MPPLVTVVTPTYNGEKYIGETIRSVLEQDFRDFEHLIVDDASTDGTGEVVRAFAESDPRVRYIRLGRNSGQPATPRNVAIRNARGTYIALIDHDDVWLPGKLSFQVDYLERNPSVAVSHGNAYNVYEGADARREPYWKKPPHGENESVHRKLLRGCCVVSPTAVARKECVVEAGMFAESDTPRFLPDDWLLWIKISRRHPFAYHDRFLALYRLHATNITRSRRFMAESDCLLFEKYGAEMGLSAARRRLELSHKKYQLAKAIHSEEKRFPRAELWESFRLNPLNWRIYGFLARIGFQRRS